jgi:two-component system sensor kinase FixL
MSWVTIIWSMVASACLTLASVHLLVWCNKRTAWGNLLFSVTSVATAAFAGCELWMMRAETPEQFTSAVRWIHVPTWVIIVSLVGFVRLYLRAGRPWLGWTVCTLRTFALLADFLTGQNLNYRAITSLRHVPLFGESVSAAEGVPNPWMLVGQLSLLLFMVFVADATLTVWRRGDQRQAIITGGSILACVLAAMIQSGLIVLGILYWPSTVSLFFMTIVMAMGFEISRDVRRAAQLSENLRASEERMSLAANAARLRHWEWDLVRDKLWAAGHSRTHSGTVQSGQGGFNEFLQSVHTDDREPVSHAVAKSMNGEGEYECEYRVPLPDGAIHWMVSRGRVEFDSTSKPIRMRGVSVDITAHKLAQAEALRQRVELAHVARISTMGALASSLAHELNQPLSAILSNAQAASRFLTAASPDLTEVRGALEDIAQDTKRAGQVIHQMRALVRKDEPHMEPLDLNRIIPEVVRLLHSDMLIRKVQIALELDPSLCMTNGDSVQLQQVLLNLVLNAFDAMKDVPEDRRTVTVRTLQPEAGLIRVEVSDCGTGISPERFAKLFEPFLSSKREGLGLGLSISHSIIQAHKGRLWAVNNPDRGATFRFTLPVQEAELILS